MVEIETWCQSEGRIGTRRDWILKDIANAEVTGCATRFPSHHFFAFSIGLCNRIKFSYVKDITFSYLDLC